MGIISEIGRKNIKVRMLIWFISLALIIGAITMIYPFALMISGSSKSGVDLSENQLIPSFLTDNETMYQKSVEALFNERSTIFQAAYDLQNGDFKQLELPDEKNINERLVKDWNQFIKQRNYEHYYYGLSFIQTDISKRTIPINLRRFKRTLAERFDNNLEAMNQSMQLELTSWNSLGVRSAEYLNRRIMPNTDTELYNTYYAFKARIFDASQEELPLVNRYFLDPEGYYKTAYLRAQYTQKIGNYNEAHKTKYKNWDEVQLTRVYPADRKKYTDLERKDWEEFVRTLLNRLWIKVDPKALPYFHSYLKARYDNKIADLNQLYNSNYKSFDKVEMATQLKEFPFFGSRIADWSSFIAGWEDEGKTYKVPLEYLEITSAVYDFRDHLKGKYKTIAAVNELFHSLNSKIQEKYNAWKEKIIVHPGALPYYQSFLKAKYKNKIADFNKLYNSSYKSFAEVKMPPQLADFSLFKKRLYDWGRFITGWNDKDGKHYQLPLKELQLSDALKVKYKTITEANNAVTAAQKTVAVAKKAVVDAKDNFVKLLAKATVKPEVLADYQTYLEDRYGNIIGRLNEAYDSKYKKFSEIKLATQLKKFPDYGVRLTDWSLFLTGNKVADEDIKPAGVKKAITAASEVIVAAEKELNSANTVLTEEKNEHDLTKETISKVNMALFNANKEFNFADWSNIKSPQQAAHYQWIKKHSAALKWEFLKRNFLSVFDYILLHGRAIWNTFIYCASAVLCALIVNPLAAYALSRFNPPSTYKILLFLMVTMAFPPMVTQIPVFLLLRELNLLNTYGALILPALANGYSIFLLKGFFDSLPQELYESAQIDGASECRIFLQITMSLSKPILAVISLQTFQLAYSNFMMALLYCQDETMWTIMPWLYQLQSTSCRGVIFASLIIAALPTFLVFTFCQNIIMRGIVVPVEK
jgi:ABC-type glycerol-3-phosphate transport system permease component